MREKARRMMLLILLTTGSLAAYPQNNFPQNITEAHIFWNRVVTLGSHADTKKVISDWNDYSQTALTMQEAEGLDIVMHIWKNQVQMLPKVEQLFAQKHGHLAVYLSAANPLYTAAFDRVGPWALTFPDARRYGLVINEYVDERRDFAKSTAAARLLFEDLKELHGANAELAFVLGAAGKMRATQTELSQTEEQLAVLRMLLKNQPVNTLKPVLVSDIVQTFQEEIELSVLLANAGWTEEQFRSINPTLVGNRIPARQAIALPSLLDGHQLAAQSRQLVLDQKRAQDSLMVRIKSDNPDPNTHQVISYRVKSGDVLGRIAERYNVPLSQLKKWNNLRSDRIDINQKLTIYYPKGKAVPSTTAVAQTPKLSPEEKGQIVEERGKFTIYEVQPGDTLWAICRRFEGVKPEQIMAWNGIGEHLSIGQKLKIKVGQ